MQQARFGRNQSRRDAGATHRPYLAVTLAIAGAMVALGLTCTRVASQEVVRVVAYNIKHGQGMDEAVDLPRIAAVLRDLDADVITLQEVDDRTERTGGVDQVAVLADLLGYAGFHGPHRPYQGGYYGNGVLTRLPVRAVRTHPIPPASGSELAVLEVVVEVPGTEEGVLSVVSVHLAGSEAERLAQADRLTEGFGQVAHPVVLAGDFNGWPDGPVVTRLTDDWRVLGKESPRETYPADVPDREIDFIMARIGDRVRSLAHRVVVEPLASDHRPILADLEIR